MIRTELPMSGHKTEIFLPEGTDILTMGVPAVLPDPGKRVREALDSPVDGPTLDSLVSEARSGKDRPTAVIVISDNTRPVPYTGPSGILWPIAERLIRGGIAPSDILVLVATGMHRGLLPAEIDQMIDHRVIQAGIKVINHDCQDQDRLVHLGRTRRGSEVYINRLYMDADIRILTGLVESHFMAGASGGRKSICPGLIGEDSTLVFHGPEIMGDPNTTDLLLDGNPCHEEALEVASAAGAEFIVNVTLNHEFRLTGVFAGSLRSAHEAAVDHLKSYTAVSFDGEYDIVVTHAGFVGINHYQAAKAATVAARIVKEGGHVLMIADNTDTDPVGSLAYRTVLQLLTLNGPEAVEKVLRSPDWTFIPEQWQVQMWNRLFRRIPINHFNYYSPQFQQGDYACVPGNPLPALAYPDSLWTGEPDIPAMIDRAIDRLSRDFRNPPRIAYLKDGPYGIPIR